MANTFNLGNGNWAQKTEKLLAYNAENDNYKPLPFDFDRASTATRVNRDGLIETVGVDEPRIDFTDNTKGHLLLEPSRSNLETKSNEFSTWSLNSNITRTADYIISPDGTLNGTRMQFTANGYVGNTTQVNTTQYTISCYAKRNDSGTQNVGFFINGSGVVNSAWAVTSEWKRFTYTYTSSNTSFVGIAGISGADISVYGFQIEQAVSYATSYIPTQGIAATRSVDFTKIVNSPILQGTNQFTLFFDAKDFLIVNGTNTSFDNVMLVFGAGESAYDSGTGIHIYDRTWYYFNGSSAVNIGVCYNGLTDNKFAISYDGTKFTRYAGGIKLGEFVTSASMVNWDTITTGAMDDAQNDERNFNLSDLRLYNTALTDAELIALTS